MIKSESLVDWLNVFVLVIWTLSFVDQKKQAVGYKCPTLVACKHLWKCAVEQQYFYTYCVLFCSRYFFRLSSTFLFCSICPWRCVLCSVWSYVLYFSWSECVLLTSAKEDMLSPVSVCLSVCLLTGLLKYYWWQLLWNFMEWLDTIQGPIVVVLSDLDLKVTWGHKIIIVFGK